jgi:hypothetical protein
MGPRAGWGGLALRASEAYRSYPTHRTGPSVPHTYSSPMNG